MSRASGNPNGEFSLYDLRVAVEHVGERCTCSMTVGDSFTLKGGKIAIPGERNFCLYALQAVIPLLPAKQRMNQPADWMETDAVCTCPDPHCGLLMRIQREQITTFRHDDVSALPWNDTQENAGPPQDRNPNPQPTQG